MPITKHLPFVSPIDQQKKFKAMSMLSDASIASESLMCESFMSSDASLSSDESRSRRSSLPVGRDDQHLSFLSSTDKQKEIKAMTIHNV